MRKIASLLILAAAASAAPAWSQVQVAQAWARATVQGQLATGAFMTLTSPTALRLVGVSSPIAGAAELHEMKVDNGVMHMRAITELVLPAQRPVALKPGGHHIMLIDLKAPLRPQHPIALTLHLQDASGKMSKQVVTVPVAAQAPAAAGHHAPGHAH